MNKKEYKKPLVKVICAGHSRPLCTSVTSFRLNDDAGDYGEEEEQRGISQDIWGTQW